MRFTLPVLDGSEVGSLAECGADELYCGFLSEEWRLLYGGDATVSRRQGAANLSSAQALEELLSQAARHGIPVHLALNARVTAGQLPLLEQTAEQWAALGGSGIILQDPVLLQRLRRLSGLVFTVSLLTETVNARGAAFWRDLGADRIVLPRALALRQMEAITGAVRGVTWEAMVMGDLCPFADGLCRSVHAESFPPAPPGALPTECRTTCNPSGRAHHLCLEYGPATADPCAACDLRRLAGAGIAMGKVGGRGLPLEIRLRWLRFLRTATQTAQPQSLPGLYRHTFAHDCRCYYPREEEKT